MDQVEASATQDPSPRLDRATLESLVLLGERRGRDLLGHLVGIFESQVPDGIEAMRGAVRTGSAKSLSDTAHSLKGSCQSLGAPRLAALALELEMRGREGVLDGCDLALERLEQEFESTVIELHQFLQARNV